MTYFDYTPLVDGYTARAAMFNPIFEAVKDGFEMLPTETQLKLGLTRYGADTGAANAHVVALPYTPTAYTDGMEVRFKAVATNTGAATVNVNSLGVKTITRQSGADLQAGDILVGKMACVVYNSTSGKFELQSVFADVALKTVVDAIAAISAGSGVVVSTNDTTPGVLDGKLLAGEGVDLTVGSEGGNETFTISCEDATTSNKGVVSVSDYDFTISSGALSIKQQAHITKTQADSPYTVLVENMRGNVAHDNTGASSDLEEILPTPAEGLIYMARVTAAQYFKITAPTGKYIYFQGGPSASGGYIRSNVPYSTLELTAFGTLGYLVTSHTGLWTIDE